MSERSAGFVFGFFSLVQSMNSDGVAKCFRNLVAKWFGALGVAQIRAQMQKGEKITEPGCGGGSGSIPQSR